MVYFSNYVSFKVSIKQEIDVFMESFLPFFFFIRMISAKEYVEAYS